MSGKMNGNEGSMVTRPQAQLMMTNYKNSPSFASNNSQAGILFGKNHITAILNQAGCVGVRIYYGKSGITSSDVAHLILVGTDDDGNDMPNTNFILDMGVPCPSECSSPATKL